MTTCEVNYIPKNSVNKWNFTKEGHLPDTDREVLVINDTSSFMFVNSASITTSSFTPSLGWKRSGEVIAWKEIDHETKEIIKKYNKTSFKYENENNKE